MDKFFTILKYAGALFLTFFVIPGMGHLLLAKFKKAFIILGAVVLVIIISSIFLMMSVDANTIPKDYPALREYASKILSGDSINITFIYILMAALWSYSAADIIFMMIKEIRDGKK
ncbi:MAG: hypothetical protein LBV16_07375 [Elusimicrobiota bacterium]|jgi:hypothetical protein|nr:hypothetical protein [Elusimicrobiota bacterium]